ncbi:taste receptor type 2 member 9-like [Lissotriton helveticus]
MTSQVTAAGLLTVSSLLLCTCLFGNLFILESIVPCRCQGSIQALPTNELIISSLAVVNIFNGVCNFLCLVVYLLGPCQHAGWWLYQVLDFVFMTASGSAFWFTACLSAFHTLKISNFNQSWLISLRLQAHVAVPRVLLILLLASSILSVPPIVFVRLKAANGSEFNCCDYYKMFDTFRAYNTTFHILAYLLPLLILIICSILLVVSLCLHSRRIGGGTRAAVHLRVAKMVLVLLVFYTVCIVFTQVSLQRYANSGDWFVTSVFVLLVYSSGTPFALTWGTVRLHRRLLELCCSIKHRLLPRLQ